MSRHSASGSYGHNIEDLGHGDFRLTWKVDRYYPDSRLRHPQVRSRDTDEAGARRFALKHDILLPSEQKLLGLNRYCSRRHLTAEQLALLDGEKK